jgi:DNA-binding transcriptional ArsR family regulator
LRPPNIRIHNRPAYNSEVHATRDMGVGELNNCYEDAELADTIVAVDTNAYETQTNYFLNHWVPNLRGSSLQKKKQQLAGEPHAPARIVVVDPRRTSTVAACEVEAGRNNVLHLAKRLNEDTVLRHGGRGKRPARGHVAVGRPGRARDRASPCAFVRHRDGRVALAKVEARQYALALSNHHWNIQQMKHSRAVTSLAALAHRHRLTIFRLLVREGPSGMPAGDIAAGVRISATNTSFHLKELERAGLLRATRQGRQIVYAVHVEGMRKLLTYLTEDCCQGRPELCGSAFTAADKICRVTNEK